MVIGTVEIGGLLKGPPEISLQDLDSEESVRNVLGTMMRDRIGTKAKIALDFGPLSSYQMSALLAAVAPVFFTVTYRNPVTGTNRTAQFYVGDRSAGLLREDIGMWTGLKMNLIER